MLVVVEGTPAPQGSKRGFNHRTTGRVVLVESSSKVKPWRAAVTTATRQAITDGQHNPDLLTPTTPVKVRIAFHLPRPRSHYRTGRNAHLLRDTAPARPTTRPDVDKLTRSTLDALTTAGAYGDDSQVVTLHVTKHYADGILTPGAHITITTQEPS